MNKLIIFAFFLVIAAHTSDGFFINAIVKLLPKFRRRIQALNLFYLLKCNNVKKTPRLLHYGCWCGPENTGSHRNTRTVDAIDSCCRAHDLCITDGRKRFNINGSYQATFTKYGVTCKNRKTTCHDRLGTFARLLCDCDRRIAECLHPSRVQRQYTIRNIFPSKC